ncbi:MAG: 2-polyprenyl-3-methyl-6-methoxy-1,4-benzoquinone monooxygenase [Gammaproteobacteria bacterium]|nr:MAG: 2-polyprenyl-3-methyl-6-methoxy-1,4-benzoquinone monooxygenase [Gammaproteobacteria bacterium]
MDIRHFNIMDHLLSGLDQKLRQLRGVADAISPMENRKMRPSPAEDCVEHHLSEEQRRLSIALMRVNHAGEIAAQGLYHGQALVSRDIELKRHLLKAANEENDHLYWCRSRVEELGGNVSVLVPVWYWGSVAIGVTAGMAGDRWSLGFIVETEHQVMRHLDRHLLRLPSEDEKSRLVLLKMREEEAEHAMAAELLGAVPLPDVVKKLMSLTSKVMTTTAYRL